jgi:hypothetical protein
MNGHDHPMLPLGRSRNTWVWLPWLLLALAVFPVWWPMPAGAAETKDDPNKISFFDSSSFDLKLSRALTADPPQVRIEFPSPVNVNGIPGRMDKWFYQVEKNGGSVELKEDESLPTRGVLGMVLDLIIGIYELAKEHLLYSPAADYNAVIYYDKSNGNITYVLFVHKPPKS